MRSTTFAASAALFASLVAGQTFTDCDPTKKSCPAEPALGTTLTTDFTKGKNSAWVEADGTTLSYDPALGAKFVISKGTDAPTLGLDKFIMFGKVEVVMRASAGKGTVSSFILESGDLDEIDWEWLGSDDGNVQSNFFGKGNTTTYDRAKYHPMSDPIGSFHKYTIDWTAESTKWYIDDALIRTLAYSDPLTIGGKNYPQTPMKVKLGNWIGCASEAAVTDPKTKGTCEWAGGAIDLNAGPYTMYVKSVTVQDYGCATEYSYGDMSGNWQSIVASGGCSGGSSSGGSGSKPSQSTTGKPTSSSTTSAAVLIETSVSLNSTSTTKASGTTTKASVTSAASSSTLTRATNAAATTPASASTSAPPSQATTNAGSSVLPKKKYGAADMVVVALGLGMGYLFM